jgi:hypothetical protein
MKLVKENPYRIVGLLVGATSREQERQLRRIKQYLDAGENTHDDFSFPVLGALHRTPDSVNGAASKLNLDADRMDTALYWFYDGNSVTDEPAFQALKDQEIGKARDIWTKLAGSGEINARNCSAFQNLSTLLLSMSINGVTMDEHLFEEGLSLKIRFLESEFLNELKLKATDDTFRINQADIELSFLNALQQELEQYGLDATEKLAQILSEKSFQVKEDYFKSFMQQYIGEIERIITITKSRRKANNSDAAQAGMELSDLAARPLDKLREFAADDQKIASLSDKVSDEILQCGIDYFTHHRDSDTDPGTVCLNLFIKAREFATGKIAIQRCQENTEQLQEWMEKSDEREKQNRIKPDMEAIIQIMQEYEDKKENIANGDAILLRCKPLLLNIRAILGRTDELYLKISTKVVMVVMNNIIQEVNDTNKIAQRKSETHSEEAIRILQAVYVNARGAIRELKAMDMELEFRNERFEPVRSSIAQYCNTLRAGESAANETDLIDIVPWIAAAVIFGLISLINSDEEGLIIATIAAYVSLKVARSVVYKYKAGYYE